MQPTEIQTSQSKLSSQPEAETLFLQLQSHSQPSSLQPQQHDQLQLEPLSQQAAAQGLPPSQSGPQPQPQPHTHLHPPQPAEQAKPLWTNHRRLLLLLLGSSFCASILGMVYYSQQKVLTDSRGIKQVTPCLSLACERASARLLVDPFSQPCAYFLFTCGSDRPSPTAKGRQRGKGVHQHQQRGIRREQQRRRTGRKESEDISRKTGEKILDRRNVLLQYLREILEAESFSGSAVHKARGFYRSCMDTRSMETAGAEPFFSLIQKLGGWSVSGQWNQSDVNSTLSLLMRDYFTFPFFNLYVGKDPNDPDRGSKKKYIQIDQPELLIPVQWNSKKRNYIMNAQKGRLFLASCQRYLSLLGAPSSTLQHAGMFIALSSELAVAAAPLSYRLLKGQLYQRKTIKDLQAHAPTIDWLGCLQIAFHPHPVREEDTVLLHNLPYIEQMSRIVSKWLNKHELSTSGPLHTYMVLNLLHTFIPALDSRFIQTEYNLSVALGNAEETVPRWKSCVLETEKGFDTILTHLLSEKTAHTEAEEMIHSIFDAIKSKLSVLKWRDEKSRLLVMNKVHSLTPRLWTKPQISSEAELDQLFSEVTISEQSYVANYIQLLSLQQKRRNKLFSQTDEVDILSVSPLILGNELVFPMGMFVPPLFHPTHPKAMNYGVLGSLIAKDILHLLLPDIDSLSETMQAVGQCVWDHYLTVTEGPGRVGAFSVSAVQLREIWVQYSALQVAHQAYYERLNKDLGDTSLSGLSLTHLFLTSFSQINCDSDPYREFMPFEPSFLITVFCAKSELCPTTLECPHRTQQYLQKC